MTLTTVFRLILLAGLVVCAIATAFSRKLLKAIIIYTAFSLIMSVLWILLESPDLAVTEAAVGAGVTGILFFLTLNRLHKIDKDQNAEEKKNDVAGKDEEDSDEK